MLRGALCTKVAQLLTFRCCAHGSYALRVMCTWLGAHVITVDAGHPVGRRKRMLEVAKAHHASKAQHITTHVDPFARMGAHKYQPFMVQRAPCHAGSSTLASTTAVDLQSDKCIVEQWIDTILTLDETTAARDPAGRRYAAYRIATCKYHATVMHSISWDPLDASKLTSTSRGQNAGKAGLYPGTMLHIS